MQAKRPALKINGLSPELERVLQQSPRVQTADSITELLHLACGTAEAQSLEVRYDLPDGKSVLEATVGRVRNGIVANYPEPYMRRRDPDCMFIADDQPTDKPTYRERFGADFGPLREETFAWLATQELAVFAFRTGQVGMGDDALAVAPANTGFFALSLALLQGIIPQADLPEGFSPKTIIYVAPPFRHTHFHGKQVVVHNRLEGVHEIFSYNLYPGPSAKKGVYGALIRLGTTEGWITAHCSAVQVVTPYDNVVTLMHEGASGGGKSEMLQQPHRLPDGRLLQGRNIITGEERYLEIPRMCELRPVCDDMALCHPNIQQANDKLWLMDAEDGWFVRVNHIDEYGSDPELEKLTADPPVPLVFLNIDAVPDSRALIWEHIQDEPGKPCPNPRVILPRSIVPNVVDEPVSVDIRSIGFRTPPCTRENPTYGIVGLFHVLPPALAWLWRLVAPRGHANPSIVGSGAMKSEGVGSYWPFATGRKVDQANLLLQQIEETPRTRFILVPNQHIGAWECGFMPQWITRDYLARRGGAKFGKGQLVPARCALLGHALFSMRIEGIPIPHLFLEVNTQPEVGEEGYDKGAEMLASFFHNYLQNFLVPDLSDTGRRIIECCLDNGKLEDYEEMLPRSDWY
jgi:hypothetical protein